jgi:hypothetical protein
MGIWMMLLLMYVESGCSTAQLGLLQANFCTGNVGSAQP